MYNSIVAERFQNLRNAGMITGADAVGQVGSVGAGNMIKIYLRIDNGVIIEAKFKAFGSVYSLVACDMLCDMLKNSPIEDALKIKSEAINDALGGLPENKLHIADYVQSVAIDAVEDYYKKLERMKLNSKK